MDWASVPWELTLRKWAKQIFLPGSAYRSEAGRGERICLVFPFYSSAERVSWNKLEHALVRAGKMATLPLTAIGQLHILDRTCNPTTSPSPGDTTCLYQVKRCHVDFSHTSTGG